MKKPLLLLLLTVVVLIRTHAQNANQSLSNLISPTAINVSLLPGADNSISLGSSAKAWKNIYMKGDIYVNGLPFISNKNSGTVIGTQAGNGSNCVAIGYQCLNHNLSSNTAIGSQALFYNIDGSANNAIGTGALYSNTFGSENTAVGRNALFNNTDGYDNIAQGSEALYSNTTGDKNVGIGYQALYLNNGGSENTAMGYQALYHNTSGNDNLADGYLAGTNVISGSNNTFFGANANCGTQGTLHNSTAIGNGATVIANNHVVVGNSSVTSIGGYVNWSNISDGRVKENIRENVPGLVFINELKPITYHLNLDAIDNIIQRPAIVDEKGNIVRPSEEETEARKQKEQITYSGFIAQDVERAAKETGYEFSGIDAPQNENSLYGLRYADFVVPLVKSVQELSSQNNNRRMMITDLQNQIDQLEATINDRVFAVSNQSMNAADAHFPGTDFTPVLGQNISNPYNHYTLIPFRIPKECRDASIVIVNTSTKEITKVISISSNEDHIQIDRVTFPAGSYSYSLYIDGNFVEEKLMQLDR